MARRVSEVVSCGSQSALTNDPKGQEQKSTPLIKRRQSNRLIICSPLHPAPFMRGDVDVVAGRQENGFVALFEVQRCLALDQQHSFMLALVVSKTGRCLHAVRAGLTLYEVLNWGLQAITKGQVHGQPLWLGGADPRREGVVMGD